MPKWIHDRANHIRAKNPEMPESESFAIATLQAKKKDPGHMSKSASFSAMWMGFSDELLKIASAVTVSDVTKSVRPQGLKPAKLTSRPVVKEPDPPASTLDHLSSSRILQPPPVTSGG